MNFKAYGLSDEELNRMMVHEANLGLNAGHIFGKEGDCCMRMNLACPRSIVEIAMNNLKRVFVNA